MIKLIITENYDEMSRQAFLTMKEVLTENEKPVKRLSKRYIKKREGDRQKGRKREIERGGWQQGCWIYTKGHRIRSFCGTHCLV